VPNLPELSSDLNVTLACLFGIFLIYLVGRIFLMPLNLVFRFGYNAIIGGIMLWVVNSIGEHFDFAVTINPVTVLVAGIIGILWIFSPASGNAIGREWIIMKAIWPRKILASLMDNRVDSSKTRLPLTEAVEQARQEWLYAQNYYNSVSDVDLVDHAVYLLQAAEKKHVYLMKIARSQGVINSPFEL